MPRRRTTLRDIAEDVGVHVSTVSRALNTQTRHFIRPELADRIMEASKRLEYQPNAAAYSLRTNKTRTIGVVIPDITNPVFPPIIRGLEALLSERGYMAILVNSDTGNPRHGQIVEALRLRGVDGLIMASLERDDPTLRNLMDQGLPVVCVNRRAENADLPSVTSDESAGIRLVLEHLRSLGHKRVVNIAGPQHLSTGKGRYEAFMQHSKGLGFDVSPELVVFADRHNDVEGERCANEVLGTMSGFSAIVASNDRLAVGAISVLRQRGITCPGMVSVTGFNDMPLVDRLGPPLTTVRVRQHEAGRRAAEMLLRMIEEGPLPPDERHFVLPVEIVVRASTARPSRVAALAG